MEKHKLTPQSSKNTKGMCVVIYVESIVESWISVMEYHTSKTRDLTAESLHNKLTIVVNGPLSQHCQSIVKESMRAYWIILKNTKLLIGHFV